MFGFSWGAKTPDADPQSTGVGQEGDKVGIIIVDGTIGSESDIDMEDMKRGMTPDEDDPVTRESVDIFKPRQPGTRIQPGDNFRPGGADSLQQQNLPR